MPLSSSPPTDFAHRRLHRHSGWFPLGGSGITRNVAVVTLSTSAPTPRPGLKHLSFPRAPAHLSQPLCHEAPVCSSQPPRYKPVNVRGLQPVSPSTHHRPSLTVHRGSSHSKCTLLYAVNVAKRVLWKLQKAIATNPILARKINHMLICRTGSTQYKL